MCVNDLGLQLRTKSERDSSQVYRHANITDY